MRRLIAAVRRAAAINFPLLLDIILFLAPSSSFVSADEVARGRPCRPRRIVETDGAGGKKEHDDDADDDDKLEEESHRTSVVAPARGIIIIVVVNRSFPLFQIFPRCHSLVPSSEPEQHRQQESTPPLYVANSQQPAASSQHSRQFSNTHR